MEATRRRQRATRRRQREEGRTENRRGEKEEATKRARRGQEEEREPNSARTGRGWGWRNRRGSAAARLTLTRNWGEPQIKDPMPNVNVSVNPTKNPPRPGGQREKKDPDGRGEEAGGSAAARPKDRGGIC